MNWQANLEVLDKKCTWFIGDDINSYVLWNMQPGKIVNFIDDIENYDLFEEMGKIKAIFSKEFAKKYEKFLENSNCQYWNKQLFIHASSHYLKYATKLAEKHGHQVILLNDLARNDLVQLFGFIIKKYDMHFSFEQVNFIKKYVPDLRHLIVCNLLSVANISLNNWQEFLPESSVSWYKYLKEGKLLLEGIINTQKIIPIMQYMLRADSNIVHKGILEFLASMIKDGAKIYEYNNLWKELL